LLNQQRFSVQDLADPFRRRGSALAHVSPLRAHDPKTAGRLSERLAGNSEQRQTRDQISFHGSTSIRWFFQVSEKDRVW
jgi:hypothetical protein